jgi:hypothetical protein
MFALVDPENSKEALIKKLEQMAFDFIGDDSQAELFAKHGIQVREPKPLGGYHPKVGPPMTPDEIIARDKQEATEAVGTLCYDIQAVCIGEKRKIQLADPAILRLLEGDLIDAIKNVRTLLKAG